MSAKGNWIGGDWRVPKGRALQSTNPAEPSEVVYDGAQDLGEVNVVDAAASAFRTWRGTFARRTRRALEKC